MFRKVDYHNHKAVRADGVQRKVSLCRDEGVEGEPEGGLRQFTWMINEPLAERKVR